MNPRYLRFASIRDPSSAYADADFNFDANFLLNFATFGEITKEQYGCLVFCA